MITLDLQKELFEAKTIINMRKLKRTTDHNKLLHLTNTQNTNHCYINITLIFYPCSITYRKLDMAN